MPPVKMKMIDRLKQLLAQNRHTLLAFAIPAFILFVGFMTRGVFPVGNRDVLTIDLYHQYAPFLAELQDKYTSGGSLFYSFAGGLGTNFLALFAYYLASPLNILIVLFPPAFLTEAIMLLIIIKLGLAAAFFFLFLRGVWKQDNLHMVVVSILYALSAYSLAYFWNIMWLDGIFLLPLIMLGVIKLVRDKRYLLYCISLALLVVSNYYISFFVILFTILYFPVVLFQFRSFAEPKQLLASVGRFAGFSLLAAGLSAVLSLPTYFSLQLTSAAGDKMPGTVTNYFDLFDYIGQHFMLTPPTIRDGMPNMYCGVLVLILVPIYFFARSIPLKQKFLNLALILVMILSFNLNVLNFIWHGFHFPNQLPYRNSFVYIFLILTLAYPALRSLHEFTGKQIGAICAAAVGIVLLAQKLNDKAIELQTLYVTIIFIVIYAAVLTLNRVRKISAGDMALALLVVVVAELLLNTLLTFHRIDVTEVMSSRNGYFAGAEVDEIRSELKAIAATEDNFYRVESIPPKTTNDGFMYGYNGLSIFASTMATDPVRTFERLGFHSNGINSYKYEGSTVVLDSLFGIKYLIRRSGTINDQLRQSIVKTDELEVYKNPYALSLGYMGSPDLENWASSGGDPFTAQNRLVSALTGVKGDVLLPLGQEKGSLVNMTINNSGGNVYHYTRSNKDSESIAKVKIINEKDQQVYLYLDVTANKADRGFVMIDSARVDFNAKRSTLIDLGFVSSGAVVEFNIAFGASSPESGQFELYSYALDKPLFEESIAAISKQSLQISKFSDTRIEGTVNVAKDGVFMLTIPYDKGWKIKVDGDIVETDSLDNAFLSFNLTAGTHKITMSYVPEWFFIGLLISLVSLLILLVIYQVPWGPGRRNQQVWRQPRPPEIRTIDLPEEDLPEAEGCGQQADPEPGADADDEENDR